MLSAAEQAEAIYQDNYTSIKQYVDFLASDGVDRGLIGPREVPRLWDRHILNSVALESLVPTGASAVDVGSGAGLPGIPLALARPDLSVTLLEPLLRRSVFLTEVLTELGLLGRVQVVRARAEDHRATYDVVLSRAVAPLPRLLEWCAPLRRPSGTILAVKGQAAAEELRLAAPAVRRLGLVADILSPRAHPEAESATVIRLSSAGRGPSSPSSHGDTFG